MKNIPRLITIVSCLSGGSFLSADLPQSGSIIEQAFDKYPAGATDLMRTGGTTVTTINGPFQVTFPSSEIHDPIAYAEEVVIPFDLSFLIDQVLRLQEENRLLHDKIETLKSQIHPKEEEDQQVSDGNAGKSTAIEREP